MPSRHDDNDGSDIFWPGYVDATTNLILNLLFLLTILIIAVFMFALELGRSSPIESAKQEEAAKQAMEVASAATSEPLKAVSAALTDFTAAVSTATTDFTEAVSIAEVDSLEVTAATANGSLETVPAATTDFSEAVSAATTDFSEALAIAVTDSAHENMELKSEIQRLNTLLEQQLSEHERSGSLAKTVEATLDSPKPPNGLDEAVVSDFEVMVRFKDDAVAFTAEERERLIDVLQPVAASEEASIYVEVPAGFSESKRMGFYRALAVRNLLLEMELPNEKINVLVVEVDHDANASLVKVRSR